MNKIPIKNGLFVIVDEELFEDLSKHKWYVDNMGYPSTPGKTATGKRQPIRMHVKIMGNKRGFVIDHINGNKLDNRISNLRFATRGQNAQNAKNRVKKTGTSLFRGVVWRQPRQKWEAYITYEKKRYGLGGYKEEAEAALAYNEYAIKFYGEHAMLNQV